MIRFFFLLNLLIQKKKESDHSLSDDSMTVEKEFEIKPMKDLNKKDDLIKDLVDFCLTEDVNKRGVSLLIFSVLR